MIFLTFYRLSFYAMLLFASLTLSVGLNESKVSMLFPIVVAINSVVAFWFVDWQWKLRIPKRVLDSLALGSIPLALLEWVNDPSLVVIALGHLLVYLQLVLMLSPKSVRVDWNLFALGLVEVLVGTVISQSDQVGTMMITWALLALWVFGLFSLYRESLRASSSSAVQTISEASHAEPYPRLFSLSFFFSSLRVMATSLALGGVIFLAMPRSPAATNLQTGDTTAKHLTGFGDEVQLGQLGEILENDTVVMTVKLYDEPTRETLKPADDAFLWRGVTLDDYRDARWHRTKRSMTTFPNLRRNVPVSRRIIQEIKLEATDSEILFALRPMIIANSTTRGRPDPLLNSFDGTLLQSLGRAGTFDYRVISDVGPALPQPGEQPPSPGSLGRLKEIPEGLRPRLEAIAGKIVAGIPPEDVEGRSHALETYLRDSGEFSYSLQMNVIDPNVDPVEDFLVNRKRGHCEYFASALTLMLRAVDIPARMVNGFKGGDWNELAEVLNVRQKHAHSWVEAYLMTKDNQPLWLTLDPTPALEREESVAKVGGMKVNFLQLTDLIRYVWVFYVVGYNAERQNRFIYQPARALMREAQKGYAMLKDGLKTGLAKVFKVRDVRNLISIQGFFVSFAVLLLLVACYRLLLILIRRIATWLRGDDARAALLTVGAGYYRRMAQLLAECGLERPPAETQAEFAQRAYLFLTGGGSATEAVAEVPALVVDAFYRVRFGHLDLDSEDLRILESRLDELEATLHATQA